MSTSQDELLFSDDEEFDENPAERNSLTDRFLSSIRENYYQIPNPFNINEKENTVHGIGIKTNEGETKKQGWDQDEIFQMLMNVSKEPVQDVFLRPMICPPKNMDHYDFDNELSPSKTMINQISEVTNDNEKQHHSVVNVDNTEQKNDMKKESKMNTSRKKKTLSPEQIRKRRNKKLAQARAAQSVKGMEYEVHDGHADRFSRKEKVHTLRSGEYDEHCNQKKFEKEECSTRISSLEKVKDGMMNDEDDVYMPPVSEKQNEKIGRNTTNGDLIIEKEKKKLPSSPKKLRKRKIDNWESDDDLSLYDIRVKLQKQKARKIPSSVKKFRKSNKTSSDSDADVMTEEEKSFTLEKKRACFQKIQQHSERWRAMFIACLED